MSRQRRSSHKHASRITGAARKPSSNTKADEAQRTPFAAGHSWTGFPAHAAPGILLALIAITAYANAWPNSLVFDDSSFLSPERLADVGWSQVARYFVEDVWAAYGASSGLYRPLFGSIVAAQSLLLGDWAAGYHLVNIALHAAVTVLVYRLVHHLLVVGQASAAGSGQAAFLAAAVFAVHPVHAEVVNSIFNGSELWVSIGVAGGLLWLMQRFESKPLRAWSGLGLIYLLTLFVRESAVVLPALAAGLVWAFTEGDWRRRLQRALPSLALIFPLAIYLGLRIYALGGIGVESPQPATEPMELAVPAPDSEPQTLYGWDRIAPWAQIWLYAFRLTLWPHPLRIIHDAGGIPAWLAVSSQLLLAGLAVHLLRRKRPALFVGLAFFYLALLPVTVFMSKFVSNVHLQERFLYLPSVGLTILLGFGLLWLARRRDARLVAMAVVAVVLVMTPATWARNGDWTSDIQLLESDYRLDNPTPYLLSRIVMARYSARKYAKAGQICDTHADRMPRSGTFSEKCGLTYRRLSRFDDAERALQIATGQKSSRVSAHKHLAELYLRSGRRSEAQAHFELSIASERSPAMQELRTAHMLYKLFPHDRNRLREAQDHLERALAVQPRLVPAEQLREQVAQRLEDSQH
jgi:tetratricopeptide (TPR) repeat protein